MNDTSNTEENQTDTDKPVITDLPDGKKNYKWENGREYIENADKSREIKLSSGETATIREGFGKDIRKSQSIASGSKDKTLFLLAITYQVTLIDGAKKPMEWYDEIPGRDYTKIQTEVGDLNF